jgi:hypothetical protein
MSEAFTQQLTIIGVVAGLFVFLIVLGMLLLRLTAGPSKRRRQSTNRRHNRQVINDEGGRVSKPKRRRKQEQLGSIFVTNQDVAPMVGQSQTTSPVRAAEPPKSVVAESIFTSAPVQQEAPVSIAPSINTMVDESVSLAPASLLAEEKEDTKATTMVMAQTAPLDRVTFGQVQPDVPAPALAPVATADPDEQAGMQMVENKQSEPSQPGPTQPAKAAQDLAHMLGFASDDEDEDLNLTVNRPKVNITDSVKEIPWLGMLAFVLALAGVGMIWLSNVRPYAIFFGIAGVILGVISIVWNKRHVRTWSNLGTVSSLASIVLVIALQTVTFIPGLPNYETKTQAVKAPQPKDVYSIGEAFPLAAGVTATVDKVSYGSKTQADQAASGKNYILIELTIKNESGKSYDYSDQSFQLIDNGDMSPVNLMLTDNVDSYGNTITMLGSGTLSNGSSTSGTLVGQAVEGHKLRLGSTNAISGGTFNVKLN